jgi:hypothetical protein
MSAPGSEATLPPSTPLLTMTRLKAGASNLFSPPTKEASGEEILNHLIVSLDAAILMKEEKINQAIRVKISERTAAASRKKFTRNRSE